jgi:hypothetical protein
MSTKVLDPFLSDLSGEQRAETIPPEPDRFVADFDPAFVEQILNVSKRQWKSNIHRHGQADNLWTGFKVSKRAAFCHSAILGQHPAPLKSVSSDSTHRKLSIYRRRH